MSEKTEQSAFVKYLLYENVITPSLIKVAHVIILPVAFFTMMYGLIYENTFYSTTSLLGYICFRMLSEIVITQFKIHEQLAK